MRSKRHNSSSVSKSILVGFSPIILLLLGGPLLLLTMLPVSLLIGFGYFLNWVYDSPVNTAHSHVDNTDTNAER